MGDEDSSELGDLLGLYVFSANFDGDAREEFDAIMEWVNSQILAERKRCAEVALHLNGWGPDCGKGGVAEHIADVIMRH